jgi:hypothetical protein
MLNVLKLMRNDILTESYSSTNIEYKIYYQLSEILLGIIIISNTMQGILRLNDLPLFNYLDIL